MSPKEINLGIRFLLELAALASLGYWGFTSASGTIPRLALTLGAPLLAAVLWGLFVAPRAQVQLPWPAGMVMALLILGAGAVALAVSGSQALAWAFALVIVVNTVLMVLWRQ